jgi:2-polyprenyl-3-methyl-5-hydroxy-6-metoxy-1,4-benzoquinol methylase
VTVSTGPFAPILDDLGVAPDGVTELAVSSADPVHADALAEAARDGRPVLALIDGQPTSPELARLRDALWPRCHFGAIYRVSADGAVKRLAVADGGTVSGRCEGGSRTIVYARTHADALGQTTTRKKFDANAPGWNGAPGSPGYGHYRWMRRLIAEVARPLTGLRTLDAGCGTGWVGIEAAHMGALVSAFDPSPAMVELAKTNAVQTGVDLDARVGFAEDVPFERRFELVLNSGVISFAPDPERFLDGLDALLAPGGLLVIGDLNPLSRGFRRRRRRNPLLPARELNGLPRAMVVKMLEARGYSIERRRYYQLSFPVPELMALSEKSRQAWACALLLGKNRAAATLDGLLGSPGHRTFDSWIVRARKPGAAPTAT